MLSIAVISVLAVLISNGVECGFASASSGSTSASDGSGQTFTQTNNNGHGQFTHTQHKPGGGFTQQSGPGFPQQSAPGFPQNPNFGQPGYFPNYAQQGFGGFNYGPAFPYGPYGGNPVFNPIPQQPFGYNPAFPTYQPFTPYQQPLATPQEFNQYLNSLQSQYAAGGSVAQSTPAATAFASSYLGPTKYYKQQQEQLNQWKNSPFQPGFGGVPNYAYATGAFGPNGVHQTAGVFPPNKNKPNIDDRFGGPDSANANGVPPSGFFGIQTSSFSSSSDINGVKKHKEGATITINDNGQISTHTVEN